jgi:membrane peptidoglycan carboxypeptidase
VACQAALDALPRALLAPYSRIKATGTWAPQVSLTLPFANPNGLRFDIKDLVGQCVFEEMRARLPRIPEIKVGGKMAVRSDVTWLLEPFVFRVTEGVSENAVVEVGPGTDAYVPLGQMPRYVGGAAYLTEEMNFWYGAALSPQLTSKAIATDLAGDRFVYGGSTVTQQLVKNLFLNRDKTLLRKFREAIIAGRVVDAIPKERVLELYLNCIEFGPDLFGIGRASQFYFQKHASQLSIREAIFLAMLKPSPRAGASFKRRGTEPVFPWWTRRVHQVIDRLLEAGQITAEQAETARHGHLSWTADGTYIPPDPDDPYLEAQPRKRSRSPRRGARPVAPADDESKEI